MNINPNKKVNCEDLGLIDYQSAWNYQELLFQSIISKKLANRDLPPQQQEYINNYLLICEHPHVFTLGKSGKEEHLLSSLDILESKNATFIKINRGGDITYHGPGQVIVYPIIDLENFFTDIHKYLRFLEEAVINTLAEFKIIGERLEGMTGVWLDVGSKSPRKICAMGVRSSRWVVMHGLALNVNTNLSFFEDIVPCGIQDKAVTSIEKELGSIQDIEFLKSRLIWHIANVFQMELNFGLSTSKF